MPNIPQDVPVEPKPRIAELQRQVAAMRERQAAFARRDDAAQRELQEARDADEIGYLARVTVQATLPHSKPAGDVYTRQNAHQMVLRVTALSSAGLPYGPLPRLLLAWTPNRLSPEADSSRSS